MPPEKKKVGDKENYLTDAAIYGKNRTYVRYERKKQRTVKTVLCVGGGGWIRTIEVEDNRFTVCPLWPLGNSPIFTCALKRKLGAGRRTRTPDLLITNQLLYQLSYTSVERLVRDKGYLIR